MRYLVLDLATCPIDGAAGFIEEPSAPANYKDPEKIAAYVAEAKAERLSKAALDPDLGRISAIGYRLTDTVGPSIDGVSPCKSEGQERHVLQQVSDWFDSGHKDYCRLIGFNALKFDWPFLMRRARYLGVNIDINLDRYKTPHIDLSERLTHRGILPARSLQFYAKRLGWSDLSKTLSGAEAVSYTHLTLPTNREV